MGPTPQPMTTVVAHGAATGWEASAEALQADLHAQGEGRKAPKPVIFLGVVTDGLVCNLNTYIV